MAPKKKGDDIERRREQKRRSMQKARARLKENEQLHEDAKRKERERWHKRKEEGKVVGIAKVSARKKRQIRKDWRERARRRAKEKKRQENLEEMLHNNTPPMTPEERTISPQLPNSRSRLQVGKKIARRNKEKAKREMIKMQEKCRRLERRLNKYKQRLHRMNDKESTLKKCTPRKVVKKLMDNWGKNNSVIRKKLLFGEVLTQQLKANFETLKSSKERRKIGNVLSGKLICKYKFLCSVRSLTYSRIMKYKGYHAKKQINKDMQSTKMSVVSFLEDDQNSKLCPGKRDTVTKHKVKKQKRYLCDSMKTLHGKFVKKHKEYRSMGYSTFCKLRPYWIVQAKVTARDTCLCKVHENIRLVVMKLKNLRLIKEKSPTEVIQQVVCSSELEEKCLERKCILCNHKKLEFTTESQDLDELVTYSRWVTKKVPVKIKGTDKLVQKTIKEEVHCTKNNLMEVLESSLFKFMKHVANINHQYKVIDSIKTTLPSNHVFLHIDFSENYQCKYAAEIQSAHFGGSKGQVTIHTSVLYYRGGDGSIKHISFATISENCRHDTIAVAAHLRPIFIEMKTLVPNLNTVHFLSDGVSSQYKNKLLFRLFGTSFASELKVVQMFWHYSESGHGKGAPDGVGGCLKRTADRIVAQGHDIPNFSTFVEKLKAECTGIRVLTFNETLLFEELDKSKPLNLQPFKGTAQIHQLTWHKNNPSYLRARRLTCIMCEPHVDCPHYGIGIIPLAQALELKAGTSFSRKSIYTDIYSDSSDEENEDPERIEKVDVFNSNPNAQPKENDFVVVKVSGKKSTQHYVAIVEKVENDECSVVFLKQTGDCKFSPPEDKTIYDVNVMDICEVLPQPSNFYRNKYMINYDFSKYNMKY